MRQELIKELKDKYDFLDNVEISCRDGWYNLIDEMCEEISQIDYEIDITKIKQKMGTLCVNTRDLSIEQNKIIYEYESLSYKICEMCGREGTLNNVNGYRIILCEEHANNVEKKVNIKL